MSTDAKDKRFYPYVTVARWKLTLRAEMSNGQMGKWHTTIILSLTEFPNAFVETLIPAPAREHALVALYIQMAEFETRHRVAARKLTCEWEYQGGTLDFADDAPEASPA